MKKVVIAVIAGLVTAPAVAAPAVADSAQGRAQAQVVDEISIIDITSDVLDFGVFSVDTVNGGTVEVDGATGSSAFRLGVTQVGTTAPTADTFEVSGPQGASFSVSLSPEERVYVGGPASGTFMTWVPNSSAGDTSITLGASGIYPLRVGGTLNVAAGQAAGFYEGTYNVVLTYF